VHINVLDSTFIEQARDDNFELMAINVDYPDFPRLADQRTAALAQLKTDPARVHWATTFAVKGFEKKAWLAKVKAQLAADAAEGAKAVKIWKNVGMAEKDSSGKLIFLDNPAFSPVADEIQKLGLTLIGHQAEPYNCWLPLDQMTTDNDREYFKEHPQYHMYLHPEMPGYEDPDQGARQFRGGASAAALRGRASRQPRVRRGSHCRVPRPFSERQRRYGGAHEPGAVPVGARHREGAQVLREIPGSTAVRHGPVTRIPTPFKEKPRIQLEAHDVWTRAWRYLAGPASRSAWRSSRPMCRARRLPRRSSTRFTTATAKRCPLL
jgi:hypothetical protein